MGETESIRLQGAELKGSQEQTGSHFLHHKGIGPAIQHSIHQFCPLLPILTDLPSTSQLRDHNRWKDIF